MAEPTVQDKKFQETLEKIADASKRASEGMSQQVLAVQIVDKTGKIEGGTKAIEKERERLSREKKQLSLSGPIKELGRHTLEVKLSADIQVKLNIEVVSENPIEEEE